MDFTGCGNTLNMTHPRVLQLIMDSLRYWVTEMHVDGFRFDLASTLARELHEVNRLGAFFDIIHQDPILSQVKLIAEPWDVGPGGYQVGNFPVLWTEWNGKYRDTVRQVLEGRGRHDRRDGHAPLPAAATCTRTTAASRTRASTSSPRHDGFTLQDLVSYDHKHNEANGEDNRDGADDNDSWNCGVEGPTDDPNIIALRERQKRNLIATLMFSEGVPMIFARRRAVAHEERQQQHLLPGQRADLAQLGPRRAQAAVPRVRAARARRSGASSRCCSGGSSSSAGRSAGRTSRTSRSSSPPATR